jgi:hypothetical protein
MKIPHDWGKRPVSGEGLEWHAPWGTPNQWLKKPLLNDQFIERNGFLRVKRRKIVSIVYIMYIVYMLYAPELHPEILI